MNSERTVLIMKHTDSECFDALMRRREKHRALQNKRRRAVAVLIPAAACLVMMLCLSPVIARMAGGEEPVWNAGDPGSAAATGGVNSAGKDNAEGGIGEKPDKPSGDPKPDADISGTVGLIFNKALSSISGEVIIPDGCRNEYRTYGQNCDYYGIDVRLDYPDSFAMKTDSHGDTYGCIIRMLDGKPYADNARFYYYCDGNGFDSTKGMIVQVVSKGNILNAGSNTLYGVDTVTELQSCDASLINGVSVILAETEWGEYYACFKRGDASILLISNYIDKNLFTEFITTAIHGEE